MLDPEFERIGKRLFAEGLIGGNFGNLSVRADRGLYITQAGSYLDEPGRPVYVPIEGRVPFEASTEYRVHREVYRKTRHDAVVHAHPVHAVAASLVYDEILPRDKESELLCPVIPVVSGRPGSDELARVVSDTLCLSRLVIARGHGTFAAGKTLDEAYILTYLAEHACRVLWLAGDLTAQRS
jgi:L-fuculose-phosphate aldolase